MLFILEQLNLQLKQQSYLLFVTYVSLLNTIYIGIKQMLKKFPLEEIKVRKNALFFLSQAPQNLTWRWIF